MTKLMMMMMLIVYWGKGYIVFLKENHVCLLSIEKGSFIFIIYLDFQIRRFCKKSIFLDSNQLTQDYGECFA